MLDNCSSPSLSTSAMQCSLLAISTANWRYSHCVTPACCGNCFGQLSRRLSMRCSICSVTSLISVFSVKLYRISTTAVFSSHSSRPEAIVSRTVELLQKLRLLENKADAPLSRRAEDISRTPYRVDQLGIESLVDFAAQSAHVSFDDIRLRIEMQVPDIFQQHIEGDDTAGVAHQIFE